MYKGIKTLFFGTVLFIAHNAIAQTPPIAPSYELPKYLPPSPTAAAFARYGEIPVDISTGVPKLEIPIYVVKSRQLQVPIALSYHSAGVKVEDISTPVGIGWSLMGQGVVSRSVLDRADDQVPIDAFASNKAVYKSNEQYVAAVGAASTVSQRSAVGTIIEHDISTRDKISDRFSFQLPGSGGGSFRYDFITGQCAILPFRPVKIEKILDTSGATANYEGKIIAFRITDEAGTVYEFNDPYESLLGSTTYDVAYTSWYLTRMLSADARDEILFEYHVTNLGNKVVNSTTIGAYNHVTRWRKPKPLAVGGWCEMVEDPAFIEDSQVLKFVTTYEPLLARIISATTTAHFLYTSDRQDMPGSPHRLSSILITDRNTGESVKEVTLDNSGSNRLVLNGVTIKGDAQHPDQTYSFSYQPGSLPPYNTAQYLTSGGQPSFAMDYWGYYNGASNKGLIPSEFLPGEPNDFRHRSGYAGSRRPNHFYASAYLIESVKFPTGATMEFEFEPNYGNGVYANSNGSYEPGIVGGFRIKKIKNLNPLEPNGDVKTYTYSPGTAQFLCRELFQYDQNIFYYYSSFTCEGYFGRVVAFWLPSSYSQSSSFVSLLVGNSTPIMYTNVSEFNGTENTNNSTTTYNTGKTDYQYSVPDFPLHELNLRYAGTFYNDNGTYEPKLLGKQVYKGENGSYSKVSEEKNTYTTYRENVYHMGVNVVKDVTSSLNGDMNNDFPFIYYDIPVGQLASAGYLGYINYFVYSNCYATERVTLLTKTETKQYDGANALTKTVDYVYRPDQAHLQPVEMKSVNSMGDLNRSEFKYPVDLAATGNVYQSMIAKNILAPVIEKSDFVGSQLLQSVKSNYADWGGLIAPISVETKKGAAASEVRLRYVNYDVMGNVLDIERDKDVKNSYIWGYNSMFAIAHVINATSKNIFHTSFEDISGMVATAKTGTKIRSTPYTLTLNTLANGNYELVYWRWNNTTWAKVVVPVTVSNSTNGANGTYSTTISDTIDELRFYPVGAQMTTNTYEPLIGVTSATDPSGLTTYYEYDHAGRLSVIRDNNRNIIKKIGYSYEGKPEDPVPGAFYNKYKVGFFTRNNCSAGYTGVSYNYAVPAWKYSSMISQADADQQAQNDVNANGQAQANLYGQCIPAFANVQKSAVFTKNNCPSGYSGTAVTYTVYPGTHRATTQAAADQLALDDIAANGQNAANNGGACYGTNWPFVTISTENQTTQVVSNGMGGTFENSYADIVVRFYQDIARTIPMNVSGLRIDLRRWAYLGDQEVTTYDYFTLTGNNIILYEHQLMWGYDANGVFNEVQFYLESGTGYNLQY